MAKQNPNIGEEIRGYKQSCIKEIKETQIISWIYEKIDLIINSKFIGSQQTHRKKSYIIWISKRPVGILGTGVPDLPACGLRRGSSGGPMQPSFISSSSRPSRGAKPRGADDAELPQARPHQAGSRGGGEIKAGYLTRFP